MRAWVISSITAFLVLAALFSSCQQSTDDGVRPTVGISLDSVVRRVAIPSQPMGKVFNAYVILPESYFLDTVARFYPVVYLLHGYSGNYADWYSKVPNLRELASQNELIIVTPEGNYNSWYLDSPLDSISRFLTYISQEVPSYVDQTFRTKQEARYRAVVGLSMGGHGALYIGMTRPEVFGAIGSMSGVVDLLPYPDNWELKEHLGDPVVDSLRWQQYSAIQNLPNRQQIQPLFLDCGTEDLLINDNRRLHNALTAANIPHTYVERPGAHDWAYWSEAVEYQLLWLGRLFAS